MDVSVLEVLQQALDEVIHRPPAHASAVSSRRSLSAIQNSVCSLSVGDALVLLRDLKLPAVVRDTCPLSKQQLMAMPGGPRVWAALVAAVLGGAGSRPLAQACSCWMFLSVGASSVLWELESHALLADSSCSGSMLTELDCKMQELEAAYCWIVEMLAVLQARLVFHDSYADVKLPAVSVVRTARLNAAVSEAVRGIAALKRREAPCLAIGNKDNVLKAKISENNRSKRGLMSFDKWLSGDLGAVAREAVTSKTCSSELPLAQSHVWRQTPRRKDRQCVV